MFLGYNTHRKGSGPKGAVSISTLVIVFLCPCVGPYLLITSANTLINMGNLSLHSIPL